MANASQGQETWKSVKEVAFISHKNKRRTMEDAHTLVDSWLDNDKQGFFAVYDGHGGKSAALYAAENLHLVLNEIMSQNEKPTPADLEKILTDTFAKTDEGMKPTVPAAGCTAVVGIIKEIEVEANKERHLVVANVGDARAVISRDGTAERLTYEHKATDTDEAERINAAGGFLLSGRVNGIIAVARALGDHNMKDYIIGTPHTRSIKLEETDDILIFACDGIWDIVEDQQAIDLCREDTSIPAFEMCKKLYSTAVKGGSMDNITVVVVKL
eukprot:TRINITY_DN420_c0_g1_i1.p1 TRINITY_DN420_c0_g1~~TRINITY_DN420_c0_g1_i1.p1  ORF type:complete len:271 (-),score=85.83 TRINITY_DN420_c0_g1_i1:91-903(-)